MTAQLTGAAKRLFNRYPMYLFMRSSALMLAVGYISLGLAALALFATPLWYAWRVTIQDGRSEILQADAQRLTDVFRREGAAGLTSYIDARVDCRFPTNAFCCWPTAPSRRWPETCAPGHAVCRRSPAVTPSASTPPATRRSAEFVYVALPGAYNLLVGRDLSRYTPLEHRFWYALGSAVGILSVLGALGGILIRRALMGASTAYARQSRPSSRAT
jgi:hypothetical protein